MAHFALKINFTLKRRSSLSVDCEHTGHSILALYLLDNCE